MENISPINEITVDALFRHYRGRLPYRDSSPSKWAASEYTRFNSIYTTLTIIALSINLGISNVQIFAENNKCQLYKGIKDSRFVVLKSFINHNDNWQLQLEHEVYLICFKNYPEYFVPLELLKFNAPNKSESRIALMSNFYDTISRCTIDHKFILNSIDTLVEAIRSLNKLGYSYLDSKPANIVIDKNAKFKFIDFGSVRPHGMETTAVTPVYVPYNLVSTIKDQPKSSNTIGSPRVELLDQTYVVKASLKVDLCILGVALLELSGVCIKPNIKVGSWDTNTLINLAKDVSNEELRNKIITLLSPENTSCDCYHCRNDLFGESCDCNICHLISRRT